MMAYWATIRGIRWLPYALLAMGLLFLVWRLYDAGYDSGYAQATAIYQEAENAALKRHTKVAAEVAQTDLEAVVVTATKKDSIRHVIQNITKTVDTCGSADWLREYNEAVRGADTGAYPGGVNRSAYLASPSYYRR